MLLLLRWRRGLLSDRSNVFIIAAVMLLLFGLFGYLSYVENFRNGPILAALPIWVRRAR